MSHIKRVGKTNPGPIFTTSKLSIWLDQQRKLLYSLLLLYIQVNGYWRDLETKVHTTWFFLVKSFLQKRGLKLVFLPHNF